MLQWLKTKLLELGSAEYIILLLLLTVLVIFLSYQSYRSYHRFRFMDGTATAKIRSAPQGYIELKGLGEWMPGDQIHSPFSGQRCVWFHCLIDRRQRGGKRAGWVNISDQRSEHLFHLVDETGECVIDPDDAQVIPEIDRSWVGSSLSDQTNPPVGRAGFSFKKLNIGFGGYRFRERLITTASQLYAIGHFQTHRSDAGEISITSQVEDLVREWKLKPGQYLADFDIDGNGKIQDEEWKRIYQEARRQVVNKNTREIKPQNLMSKPAQSQHPYILSAIDEERLVSRKKIMSLLSTLGAFLLFCAILTFITIRPPVGS